MHCCHVTAVIIREKRMIQYSRAVVMEIERPAAYWMPRWRLSSGSL